MLYREAGDFKTSYPKDNQTFPIKFDRMGYWVILALAFLVVPFIVNDYWASSLLVPFLIYAIAALGLNSRVGYCGQVSLGTGGFMAVGAYASYKLMTAFPGTPLYHRLLKEGRILQDGAWELCTLFDVNFQPTNMSVEELETGFRELIGRIYDDDFIDRRRRRFYKRRNEGRQREAIEEARKAGGS